MARRYTRCVGSQIDYRLARRAVIRDWRRGRLSRLDVCDAHPELIRAARHVGEESNIDCPICGEGKVRLVSYVFGDALKTANGRCVTNARELERLGEACDELACYVVEVCVECSWNYLARSFLLGRRYAV